MANNKLVIIGCGNIGRYHLDHFLKMDDVNIVGVCDIIEERAQKFAEEAKCPAFTDFKAMYDAVNPDMVFICIPPYCHGEVEFETIRRHIHMFVEKPVGLVAASVPQDTRYGKGKRHNHRVRPAAALREQYLQAQGICKGP